MTAIVLAAVAGAMVFYFGKPTRDIVAETGANSKTTPRVVLEPIAQSLPSPLQTRRPSDLGTPSATSSSVYDTLITQARSGDAAAAERLYKDARVCRGAAQREDQARAELNAPAEALSTEQAEQRAEMLSRIQRDLENSRDMCAGAYGDAVNHNAEEIVLLAAKAGNQTAAACYVRGDFHDGQMSAHDLAQFNTNSTALIDAAFAKGSWQMISTLVNAAYGNRRRHGAQSSFIMRDMAKGYAYVKLQELAATGDFAVEKGRQLQNIVDSAEVSPTAINEGDRWARDMQARFFHSPLESEVVVDCYGATP